MVVRRIVWLLIPLLGWWALGFTTHIQSECSVPMYLPPIPSSPQSTAQTIVLRPEDAETFRLCYDTVKGDLCGGASWSDGGAAGQAIGADTRGEFDLAGLTAETTYYWRVECSEGGRWRRGWEGHFTTLPSSGGSIKVVVSTDDHWIPDTISEDTDAVARTEYGWQLLREQDDAQVFINLGDLFHIHCLSECNGGYDISDEFSRTLGSNSITEDAQSDTEEAAYAETRYSVILRRMWPFLRNLPSVFVRGNHDVGGSFGDNDGQHWQFRTSWATTGIDIQLGAGGDLDGTTGIFSEAGHGMSDGDGPYRWQNNVPGSAFSPPVMDGCGGSRSASDATNEWYIDTTGLAAPLDTFRIAYTNSDTGCTEAYDPGIGGRQMGEGTGTLLRGSDMKTASHNVIAEYLPAFNTIYPHGWGPAENHIMGHFPMSDYAAVLVLDPYEFTPESCTDPECWPVDNRAAGASDGWSLGSDQKTGALAVINGAGSGVGDYADVEILLVAMHNELGGHGTFGGHPYARGGLCEVDTECTVSGDDCTTDDDCGGGSDVCPLPDCSEDFAQPDMQDLHEAMVDFVGRGGIPIVLLGHDHQCSFGVKDGVYYLHAGEIGSRDDYGWWATEEHQIRYDYNGDGVAAYYGGVQNGLVEKGTLEKGFVTLILNPSAETTSGKPEVVVDYIRNTYLDKPRLHGTSNGNFPITLVGP